MRAQHGPPKANVAASHKIARIIYFLLKNKIPYHDSGVEHYEQQQRQRRLCNLQQQAQRLGYSLEPAV